MLIEVDPCRAAGGHDGELDRSVAGKMPLQAVYDLRTFLHYGHVGTEVGVEHIVESQFTECGGEFPGNQCSGSHAELFPEGSPYRRGRLGDDHLVMIAEVVHEAVGVVALRQGTGRTGCHALSAVGAVGVLHHLVEGRSYGGVESAADCAEGSDGLDIVAHAFAAAAEYALVHVPGDGRGEFLLPLREFPALEGHLCDVQAGDEGLKLAFPAFGAGEAVIGMVGQDQLGDRLAGPDDTHRVGAYDHVRSAPGGACRSEVAASLDLHHAEAAGSGTVLHAGTLEVQVAEGGDGYSDRFRGFQDHRPFGNGNTVVVYREVDIFHGKRHLDY